MNSWRNIRPVVLAVLITALVTTVLGALAFYQFGAASPTPVPVPAKQSVSVVEGVTIVTLDTAVQAQSGIRTEPLLATQRHQETIAYGTVLDLQPLLELRTRYLSAQAEADATAAIATASRNASERDRVLYEGNQSLSLQDYQTAQATSLSNQARMQAAATNLKNVKGEILQQAGETVAKWVLEPHSPQFERFLARREILLRVIIPPGDTTQPPATIQVAGNDSQRHPAYLVSHSTQSDPAVQGTAFIYRTAALIAAGTNLAVFLPASGPITQGFFIPADAIVWQGGEPWAYVQIRSDSFARRAVGQQSAMDGGFYVTSGFKAGDRIVVRGAQLLLSEELRPPPGGAACKDPECD